MALKTGIATLALGTLFLSSSAMAEDGSVRDWATRQGTQQSYEDDDGRDGHRHDYRERRNERGGFIEVHVHTDACRHGPAPLPPPQARGRYELQTVNRWVEGRYEQVWVPEVCRERYGRHRRVTKCRGGYYEQQWVPGRYEQVQEWVWVSYGQDDGWRSRRAHAASYYP